jgi:hypothetical protein
MASESKKIEITVISSNQGGPAPSSSQPSKSAPIEQHKEVSAADASTARKRRAKRSEEDAQAEANTEWLEKVKLRSAELTPRDRQNSSDIESRLIAKSEKHSARFEQRQAKSAATAVSRLKTAATKRAETNHRRDSASNLKRADRAAAITKRALAKGSDDARRHAAKQSANSKKPPSAPVKPPPVVQPRTNAGRLKNRSYFSALAGAQRRRRQAQQNRTAQHAAAKQASRVANFAKVGAAATVAIVAISGLAEAASIAASTIKEVDETMKALVLSGARFNGPLAATVAEIDTKRTFKEMERAQKLGPELQQFAAARGELALAMDDIVTNVLKPMLPLIVDITKDISDVARGVAVLSDSPWLTMGFKSQQEMLKNLERIYELARYFPLIASLAGPIPEIFYQLKKLGKKEPPEIDNDLLAEQQAFFQGVPFAPKVTIGPATKVTPWIDGRGPSIIPRNSDF